MTSIQSEKYIGFTYYYSKKDKDHIKYNKTKYSKTTQWNAARRFHYYDCCLQKKTCEICNPYKMQEKKKNKINKQIIKESIRDM